MAGLGEVGSNMAGVLRALAEYQREVRADGRADDRAVARAKEDDLLKRQALAKEAHSQEQFQGATRFLSLALSVASIAKSAIGVSDALAASANAAPASTQPAPDAELPPDAAVTPKPEVSSTVPSDSADVAAEGKGAAWYEHVELGVSTAKQLVEGRLGEHDERVRETGSAIDRVAKVRDRLSAALREDQRLELEIRDARLAAARASTDLGRTA